MTLVLQLLSLRICKETHTRRSNSFQRRLIILIWRISFNFLASWTPFLLSLNRLASSGWPSLIRAKLSIFVPWLWTSLLSMLLLHMLSKVSLPIVVRLLAFRIAVVSARRRQSLHLTLLVCLSTVSSVYKRLGSRAVIKLFTIWWYERLWGLVRIQTNKRRFLRKIDILLLCWSSCRLLIGVVLAFNFCIIS